MRAPASPAPRAAAAAAASAAAASSVSAPARSRAERSRRLAAWGRPVVKRLRELGLDVQRCSVDDARARFVPDGRLGLRVEPERVEVSLELGPGDLPALRALLSDPGPALELVGALAALPEQFALGPADAPGRAPAARLSSDDLRALLDREATQRGLWLGWTVPSELAAAHASTLDEQLRDAVVALGEVLALVQRGAEMAARPWAARREARRSPPEDEREPRRPRARARAGRDRDRDQDRVTDPPPEPGEREAAPAPAPAGPPLEPRLRRWPGRALTAAGPAPHAALEKGSRVVVLQGAFTGKVGVVQELDGKGGALVMLGLLAVRLDAKDIVIQAKGRGGARLSSSHRKPVPVRS